MNYLINTIDFENELKSQIRKVYSECFDFIYFHKINSSDRFYNICYLMLGGDKLSLLK